MICPTRVKYLPGDLIRLSNGEEAIVISVYSLNIANIINYTVFTPSRYLLAPCTSSQVKYSAIQAGETGLLRNAKILHRLFESQRNYICQEDRCVVKNLLGGCYWCSLKVDYSKKYSNVFIPGDTVWVPSEKREAVITDINLCILDPWLPKGHLTISKSTAWTDASIYGFIEHTVPSSYAMVGEGRLNVSEFYAYIQSDPSRPPGITCFEEMPDGNLRQLSRNIKMREQSKFTYFIPQNADTICNSCIYTDCENCKTHKFIK